MNIYVIIGASCAGKSSFTKNSFLSNVSLDEINVYKDLMTLSETKDCVLIGNYVVPKEEKEIKKIRRVGSDTILRTEICDVPLQITRLLSKGKDIVLEGDRITSHKVFDSLLEMGVNVQLFLIDCSIETTLKRNKENNSTCNPSTLKRVRTKAINIFNEYASRMNGKKVCTDHLSYEEIKCYNKDNYESFDTLSYGDMFNDACIS